jgi:hypothetical protein
MHKNKLSKFPIFEWHILLDLKSEFYYEFCERIFFKTLDWSKHEYTYRLPFAGSHFTDSQTGEEDPWIKLHNSVPSLDRSTKTVRQIKQVFELYHMMFKEWRGEKKK